jgi:GNAT superfamily N-acetyltransferase
MLLALATAYGQSTLSMAADGGLDPDVGGAICWHSSSYVPVFNGAGLFHEHLFNLTTLTAIDRYFAARIRPYCLVTVDGLVPDSAARLRGMGYSEFDATPAMWLDGPPNHWDTEAGELKITRVQTPRDLAHYRSILRRIFMIPGEEIDLVLGPRALDVTGARHYLGWMDGEPVATTSLVLSGPVPGIWNVGTLLYYRRRGIGAELMYHALAEAASLGHTSSMLLASPEGLPLYRRLGYETISTVRMFVKRET